MLILSQQENTARFILPVSCVHTSKQFWFTLVDGEMKLRQYGKKLIHDHCNIHQQHEKSHVFQIFYNSHFKSKIKAYLFRPAHE